MLISESFRYSLRCAAIVAVAYVSSSVFAAELRLGGPFSDDMVLQRGKPIPVWGWAEPNAKVEATLGDESRTVTADADGRWQATFAARKASLEPVTLKVAAGDEAVAVERVLVGDVWLCSGQSNMQMTLSEIEGGDVEIRDAAKRTTIRLLSVPRAFAGEPKEDFDANWRSCSPESAANFTAVGWFFSAALSEEPALEGVPIGLIDCSFGGTAAEAWISKDALAAFEKDDLLVSLFGIAPGLIHDGMIAPLSPFPIAGVLWYQGESNAGKPELYVRMLSTLIADWRKEWNDPELPFLVVQLPPFLDPKWPFVREAQAEFVRLTPRTALATTIDTTEGYDLHPKEKQEIGRRLALAARKLVYGSDVVAAGPTFRSAVVEGDAVRVQFDTAGDGLAVGGCEADVLRGFAVAGEDGAYRFAEATIDGDAVVARSAAVPSPKTVRYAWGAMPDANLTNRSGLPAAPFRTDGFAYSPMEILKTLPVRRFATPSYEIEIAGDSRVTSLGVGGKQFLSNALGAAGGTSIPGFFGSRQLLDCRVEGPDLLSYRDNEVTFSIAFRESAMTWTLENRGTQPLQFRISLAGGVSVEEEGTEGGKELGRGDAVLLVSRVDAVEDGDDGKRLRFDVPAGGKREIELTVPAK